MSQLHFQLATITLSLYSQGSESEKVVVRACCIWMTFSPQRWTHVAAADLEGMFSTNILQQHLSVINVIDDHHKTTCYRDIIGLIYSSFLFGCLHPQNAHRRTVARRLWVRLQLWAFLQPSFLPQANDLPPGENDGLVTYPGWITASTGKGSRFDPDK